MWRLRGVAEASKSDGATVTPVETWVPPLFVYSVFVPM